MSQLMSWQLGPDDRAPSTARHLVAELVTAGEPSLDKSPLDTLLLLVSEVVTNAVHHGAPPITLSVNLGAGCLHVEVIDHGSGVPEQHEPASLWAEHGRGLLLVEALAAAWGTTPLTDGSGAKKVWFDLPVLA